MLSKAQNTPSSKPSKMRNSAIYLLACSLSSDKLNKRMRHVMNVVRIINRTENPSTAR